MPELSLPQGTIRYREDGSGPPIVFVHGALVDGRLWEPVVARLRDRFRCIVPDLPLGSHEVPLREDADLSPQGLAAIVAGVLDALALDDVTLVGNDTGGGLCQLVAVDHPERVGRLVLTDCDAFENFPPKAFRPLVAAAKAPGALRALLVSMRVPAARRLPLAYGWLLKRPIPRDVMDGWTLRALDDPGVMRDLRKALSGLKPTTLTDNTPKLVDFEKPVLLAWAREDKFFPVEHAHRLAAIFPDARVEEIADSYTFVSWDQPDRVAELVGAFAPQPVGAA
ncbi:MAG TPA: alpha/beta hydrolase [Baekduia sp.]|uniref:alpha/beta fold hydrolase n=1 Tax=Baekduia sp. TaxID=2600305 RepID=UPI002C4C6862|nr:alpha/beta hydrolase [Baekduia sp.]HMJ32290.1 alpha/beta hydrolase [Baekduia sp.]